MDTEKEPDNKNKPDGNFTISRRNTLILAAAAAAGGYAHVKSVGDKKDKEAVERMFSEMSGQSTAGGEIHNRYSTVEILKGFANLDMFPVEPTNPDKEKNYRKMILNMELPNSPNATWLSGSYEKGHVLDEVVSKRLAEDNADRKDGTDLSLLVGRLLAEGSVPTDQTLRLVNERIEKSRRSIGRDDTNTTYNGYDWKRDAEIMEKVKAEIMKAKYASRGQTVTER